MSFEVITTNTPLLSFKNERIFEKTLEVVPPSVLFELEISLLSLSFLS
jgi:hypothetical protein